MISKLFAEERNFPSVLLSMWEVHMLELSPGASDAVSVWLVAVRVAQQLD